MSTTERSICPGCGLQLPRNGRPYDRKFHASAECWAVFEQVLAREYEDTVLFGMVHQLTVDTYVVQHAGAVIRTSRCAFISWVCSSPRNRE